MIIKHIILSLLLLTGLILYIKDEINRKKEYKPQYNMRLPRCQKTLGLILMIMGALGTILLIS